ncbi:hypothetical protein [Planotetraspora sp. GP83]|uniref:hypothetical protein n=1 Tax=Planotetraspora sp. GP83 TaxID=3156264 RepID=UPI003516BFBE
MREPDFVVLRLAGDLPEGLVPPVDGAWVDRGALPRGRGGTLRLPIPGAQELEAVPSGRFERAPCAPDAAGGRGSG